jgi:hypothetical protein
MTRMPEKVPDKLEHHVPTAEPKTESEEGLLRQWSRRKHEARKHADEIAPEAPAPAVEPSAPAKVLTDADMPPLESLGENSDYSFFMSPGVSEALRRQALRRLFMLPSINQRCPLDSEYHDCHGFVPLGNIITHEMREELEREAQKLKQAATRALFDDKNVSAPTTLNTVMIADQVEKRDVVSESLVETTAVTPAEPAPRSRRRSGPSRKRAKRSRS